MHLTELPVDPQHPNLSDSDPRLHIETHHHTANHDADDEYVTVTVTAVTDAAGGRIEFGPWSFLPDEARALAVSLNALADAAAIEG